MNIQYGTITDYRYKPQGKGKKLEVKVNTNERVTNWLPVKTQASSFLVEHTPVRRGDQVIVHNPFGENEDGFVDRNITFKDIPLPPGVDENKHYKKFEDGTVYIHDTKKKEISLNTSCSITIITPKNVLVTCPKATVVADKVNVDCPDIDMGLGGKGVVTGECICALTGKPHHDFSGNTKAAK